MLSNKIKQNIMEPLKLLWQFKWYVAIYPFIFTILLHEYFFPPAKDDPIFGSEAMSFAWNYVSQEVYVGSVIDDFGIFLCYFLLGASNMRNHPLLAKFIFLWPLIWGCVVHLFKLATI